MEPVLDLAKNFGPWVAICVFFIWTNWQRENGLGKRLDQVEDYARTVLQDTVDANTKALLGLREVLKVRPCLIKDSGLDDVVKPL